MHPDRAYQNAVRLRLVWLLNALSLRDVRWVGDNDRLRSGHNRKEVWWLRSRRGSKFSFGSFYALPLRSPRLFAGYQQRGKAAADFNVAFWSRHAADRNASMVATVHVLAPVGSCRGSPSRFEFAARGDNGHHRWSVSTTARALRFHRLLDQFS